MSFVEILKVIVLGIVEGFTEWLPISSTGHMILVDEIIHLDVQRGVPGSVYGCHPAGCDFGGYGAVFQ